MLRKINESKVTICCCIGAVFLVMLLLNILTVKVMDDYLYAFSFETGERITNVFQIFPSMYRHYFTMNGRLIVHFLVQIFELLPAIIFDVLNTFMFCVLIALIYYYSYYRMTKKHNALMLTGIAAMLWKFTPAFGHAFLWQDGSVNYLWPAVFVLLYLLPLVAIYDNREVLTAAWKKYYG